MTTPPELSELIRLSRAGGADPDWVQGGGGNTSIKSADGRTMWVKTSGSALAAMDETHGWAELDLRAALAVLDEPGLSTRPVQERERDVLALLMKATRRPMSDHGGDGGGDRGARPSVESSLHALLDRVVLHTHAVHLIAFLCARGSREQWRELLGELAADALYLPYVDPGYVLAARMRDEVAAWSRAHGRRPRIVLLENHGLFVAADSVDACLALHERVTALGKKWAGGRRVNPVRFEALRVDARSGDAEYPICANDVAAFRSPTRPVRPGDPADRRDPFARARVRGALLRGGAPPRLVREDDSPVALELMQEESSWRRLASGGAFTPDQICYCRTYPVVFEGPPDAAALARWSAAVTDYRRRHGTDPKVVIALELGLFHAASDLAELRVVAETHRLVLTALLRSERAGGPRFLDRTQAGFIEEWEVEKYRATRVGAGATSPSSGGARSEARSLRGQIVLLLGADPRAAAALRTAGATVVDATVPIPVVLASFGGLDHVAVTANADSSTPAFAPVIESALALIRAQSFDEPRVTPLAELLD